MTDRKHDPLPEGYQFGEAVMIPIKGRSGATFVFDDPEAAKRFESDVKRIRAKDSDDIEGAPD